MDIVKEFYPELKEKQNFIMETITAESEKFSKKANCCKKIEKKSKKMYFGC